MPYTLLNKKSLPKSQLELTLEIDAATIAAEREHVLEERAREADLPGFRKGKVPKDVIRKRMGEMALWEDAAMRVLSHTLAEIFKQEARDVIGRPEVSVTKLAPDNPAGFKVTLSLFPTLAFPDYKKIAAEEGKKPEEVPMVEEKEIDAVIEEITRHHKEVTGKKDFALSPESVKELGAFETLADFRSTVKEGVLGNKKIHAKEKRRAELLDRIVRGAEGELPDILIESELGRMETELEGELKRFGATMEKYLAETKKTADELRAEMRTDAEKRTRLQLALSQIARAENITAPKEEVDAEVKRILEQYKNTKEENARLFVETLLTNQKVIQFLENLR